MTEPSKAAIEAACKSGWPKWSTMPESILDELRAAMKDILSVAYAIDHGWRKIEELPADMPEWTPETPFDFMVGQAIAYNDETNEPLFMVWFTATSRSFSKITHWQPLPDAPKGE